MQLKLQFFAEFGTILDMKINRKSGNVNNLPVCANLLLQLIYALLPSFAGFCLQSFFCIILNHFE